MVGLEMESPMNLCKACVVCGSKENLHSCPSCFSVFYCDNPKHEKNDWDSHAEICPPFKIVGDFWVAARNLDQGVLVFLDTKARFMINGESKQRSRKIMSRVFPYSHSCLPNCRVDSFPDKRKELKQPVSNLSLNQHQNRGGIVVVRTILPVKMGDKLTVENHGVKDSDMSIHYRRLLMLDMEVQYQDICSCSSRCADPTENDSFTSAITCPKCFRQNSGNDVDDDNFGYFLPLHPLNFQPHSPWKCNSCGDVQPAIKMMARVKGLYDNFLPIWPVKLMDLKLELQESLLDQLEQDERIVGKYGIHPNHWLLYQARRFLLYKQQTLSSSKVLDSNFDADPIRSIKIDEMTNLPLNDLTVDQIKRLEKYVKRREFLLRVNERRSPGWTKNRGTNLWHLWLGKFLLANQIKIGLTTFDQLKSALDETKEALSLLREAVEIRRLEINPKDAESLEQFNDSVTKEIEKTENRVKILQQKMIAENNSHENNNNNKNGVME